MKLFSRLLGCGLGLILATGTAAARTWTDSTGEYTIEADLIAFDDDTVVLKKDDHDLVAVAIAKLSKEDQAFLKSKEAQDGAKKAADQPQTWTFRHGKKAIGRVVDYARKEVVIQRRRGKIYVNDRLYDNLPEVYQKMVPEIVNHFEKTKLDDKPAFEAWVLKLRAEPRKFVCEGVHLELENGDVYGVPFFFFSEDDLKILKPGWEKWAAADKDAERQQKEAFMLESAAKAYQQDRQVSQQIALFNAAQDWLDLWEVQMVPKPGMAGQARAIVVPARNSAQAKMAASAQAPNYVPGATRKIRRKY